MSRRLILLFLKSVSRISPFGIWQNPLMIQSFLSEDILTLILRPFVTISDWYGCIGVSSIGAEGVRGALSGGKDESGDCSKGSGGMIGGCNWLVLVSALISYSICVQAL